jgi:hypothetical protein
MTCCVGFLLARRAQLSSQRLPALKRGPSDSGGLSSVAMMEPTDSGKRDNLPGLDGLHRAATRRALAQGHVGSISVVQPPTRVITRPTSDGCTTPGTPSMARRSSCVAGWVESETPFAVRSAKMIDGTIAKFRGGCSIRLFARGWCCGRSPMFAGKRCWIWGACSLTVTQGAQMVR